MQHDEKDTSAMMTTWFNVRLALAGVAALLAGCGSAMSDIARNNFAASHPGCPMTVRERPDLKRPVAFTSVYEVTGCNATELYPCSPAYTGENSARDSPAQCSTPDWCTPAGCYTVELSARHAFAKDRSCPLGRVTATPHTPLGAAPPPDVAADLERMRMWTKTHEEQMAGHTSMSAAGCGSEIVYDCQTYGDGSTGCTAASEPAATPRK